MRVRRAAVSAVYGMTLLALTGCGTMATASGTASLADQPQGGEGSSPVAAPRSAPATLPGVGPRTMAKVPPSTRQVVLVTGQGANSSESTVRVYERTPAEAGWTPATPAWPAHNALRGWTPDHHLDDLRSPIGVFTLTAAGGRLANPGTSLPYTRSADFTALGTGFEGEPLTGTFDYVVAIDYNHVPGTSPLDLARPLGEDRGGGIWLHVDHGGPTHGCVSLSRADMAALLRALDQAGHPVVVMGPAAALAG